MRILNYWFGVDGLSVLVDSPVHSLVARERRTEAEFEVQFETTNGWLVIDFPSVEAAVPARMGRYDLLVVAVLGAEPQTLDFSDGPAKLPAWRTYIRPQTHATPMLPHLYINRSGSLSAVIRNPSYVDDEERQFASHSVMMSVRLRRASLHATYGLKVVERGDFRIERCYLKLHTNDEIVELDASKFSQWRLGRRIAGKLTIPINTSDYLPPLRYSLYLKLRDRQTADSIDIKVNNVSKRFFNRMRRMPRPPAVPVAGARVFTLWSPPTASLVAFIVRPATRYDNERIRQWIFCSLAGLESTIRSSLRRNRRPTALIFEKDAATAQDNGFALFKYLLSSDAALEFDYRFIMDRDSDQWGRVEGLDRVVSKFSLQYWRLLASPTSFFASSDVRYHVANTYSQPGRAGKYAFLRRSYFLQHGVIGLKKVGILSPGSASFPEAIVASADWEKQIMIDSGVPAECIDVVGLARWDNLPTSEAAIKEPCSKQTLLYMPTWREWLEGRSPDELRQSQYVRRIEALLTSAELREVLVRHSYELQFLAHPKFPQLASLFRNLGSHVTVLNQNEINFAETINNASAVITDYSSIVWDFVQAHKPALLFQFDLDVYRMKTGMYSTEKFDEIVSSFPTATTREEMLQNLRILLATPVQEREEVAAAFAEAVFPYRLEGNCARTVEHISQRLADLSRPRDIPDYAHAARS